MEDIKAKGEKIIKTKSSIIRPTKLKPAIKNAYAAKHIITPAINIIPIVDHADGGWDGIFDCPGTVIAPKEVKKVGLNKDRGLKAAVMPPAISFSPPTD